MRRDGCRLSWGSELNRYVFVVYTPSLYYIRFLTRYMLTLKIRESVNADKELDPFYPNSCTFLESTSTTGGCPSTSASGVYVCFIPIDSTVPGCTSRPSFSTRAIFCCFFFLSNSHIPAAPPTNAIPPKDPPTAAPIVTDLLLFSAPSSVFSSAASVVCLATPLSVCVVVLALAVLEVSVAVVLLVVSSPLASGFRSSKLKRRLPSLQQSPLSKSGLQQYSPEAHCFT